MTIIRTMMIDLFSVRRYSESGRLRYGSRFVLFVFVLFFLATDDVCVHTCDRVLLEARERGAVQGACWSPWDHAPLGSLPALAEIGGYLLLLSARAPYMLSFESAGTSLHSLSQNLSSIQFQYRYWFIRCLSRKTHTRFISLLSLLFSIIIIQNERTLGSL
jgi:hypothetical protein